MGNIVEECCSIGSSRTILARQNENVFPNTSKPKKLRETQCVLDTMRCISTAFRHLSAYAHVKNFHSSPSAFAKVGFIGLGNMGGHMARNLAENGHEVEVFDLSTEAMTNLKDSGCKPSASVSDTATGKDYIVTMLPSNPHVLSTYLDEGNILESASEGTVLIDSSTVDPAVSRKIGKQADERGMMFIDAPVSGGVGGASAGTLTFMIGGSIAAFEKSKEVLSDMGSSLVHCGDVGTGEIAKLCNNLSLGIQMIATSEALNLGEQLGMDTKVLSEIMATSTARCWSLDTYNPCPGVLDGVPASNDYNGGFGSALMLKDLGLATDAGKAAGVSLPLGAQAQEFYRLISNHGLGGKDFGVAFQFLKGKKE